MPRKWWMIGVLAESATTPQIHYARNLIQGDGQRNISVK